MTVVLGAILVIAVAAVIAWPLARPAGRSPATAQSEAAVEQLEREKSVALLAIKEAEFDRAMGKLSSEDYGSLRTIYEERALGALSALDQARESAVAEPASASARPGAPGMASFCTSCGRRFTGDDRYCSGCGRQRSSRDT